MALKNRTKIKSDCVKGFLRFKKKYTAFIVNTYLVQIHVLKSTFLGINTK